MTDTQPANPFEDAPVIYSYSRHQALEDGVLVDLTEWARELGFKYPVACTASVWHRHIVPPDELRPLGQSERGRGHDLLWMLLNEVLQTGGEDRVFFRVLFLQEQHRHVTEQFQAVCGPGDCGEAVITVMLPDED